MIRTGPARPGDKTLAEIVRDRPELLLPLPAALVGSVTG